MNSPGDREDWEIPKSEILDYTYKLLSTIAIMEGSPLIATSQIDLFGIGNVTAFRNRAMGYPMYERDAMMLAYKGEILRNHIAVTEHVMAWRRSIPVVPSHARPIHPFDSECRLLAFLNDTPYIPPDVPDDAPTLDPAEYKRWMRDTLLGKQRRDDKKASRERNVRWHQIRQDPHHEPEDWGDFLRRKRDNEAQHHRACRDEPINSIYNNMSSVGPSGSTMTMPNQSYSQPQPPPWHGMHPVPSPTSQVSPLVLPR